jgi:CheY-like chemotaxis protein
MKVLIAEDEPLLQMHLEDILQSLGCEVVACLATVKDSLSFIAINKVDLVFLDVHLSDGTSGPVAARLSELRIPMVFATAALDAGGMTGPVVGKPYGPAEIERAIATVAAAR